MYSLIPRESANCWVTWTRRPRRWVSSYGRWASAQARDRPAQNRLHVTLWRSAPASRRA
jgi:hypothetical protein